MKKPRSKNSGEVNDAPLHGEPASAVSDSAATLESDGPSIVPTRTVGTRKSTARRYQRRWNARLLLITGVVGLVVMTATVGLYYYQSATTATTYLELARAAEKKHDFENQVKWLRRYALLVPDDVDTIYQMAVAADKSVDEADAESHGEQVDAVRRGLSWGISQIGGKDPNKVSDLRVRLIKRLLQLGGALNREAELQIKELDASQDDSQVMTSLALALAGQISDGSYTVRDSRATEKADDYWGWLANQPATFVVGSALRQNPRNLDLITHFLFTRVEKAEAFAGSRGGETLTDIQLAEIELQAVNALRETPTSHAQFVLHRYLQSMGETEDSNQVIRDAAELARQRLSESSLPSGAEKPAMEAATEPSANKNKSLTTLNSKPNAYWDFLVVYDAAQLDKDIEPEQALRQMRILTEQDVPSAPTKLLEHLYFEYGRLLVNLNRPDEAMVVWQDAITKFGNSSILLPRALAALYTSQNNWEAADKATQQLEESIDASEKQIARVTDAQADRPEWIAQGRQIASDRWQLTVLKSYVMAGKGDEIGAIELLRSVVDSGTDIASKDSVEALTRLAGYYANQGIWDASAATLEKALTLDPGNTQLRQLASEAWGRSGNHANSLRQLDLISSVSSPITTIADMNSRLAFQVQLPQQQQNFQSIRDAVTTLNRQLQQKLESSADLSEDDVETLKSTQHFVQAFELTIPPEQVSAETHLQSADVAHKIDDLAKQYPKEANLQALAVERLAQAKQESDAMSALERLSKLDDRGGVYEPLVRARALSALGHQVDAAKLLIDSARSIEKSNGLSTQISAKSILQEAAVFAARGQDNELVYQALSAIPSKQLNLQILFAVTQLASNLPDDSQLLTLNGKGVTAKDLYNHWFNELKEREGTEGTYWRYLRATQLLDEMRRESQDIDRENPKMVEARELSNTILSHRPQWGDAIALEGRLSVFEGDSQNAVVQLRRAIAAGSTNLQTRQLLWQQLIALGRTEEAEQEIRAAESNSTGQSGQFSATLIELAMQQGEYTKSMEVATESANKHPEDANAQLVVAATGMTALVRINDASERDELVKQIRSSIARAAELAGTEDPRVIAANLRLAIALNDIENVDALIQQIEASDLLEPVQNQLLSQAFLAKQDLEQARKLLVRADELDPTSSSQIRLAEIYRQLERPDDEITALRTALQRDQANDRLRNLLAQKLVALRSDGKPVDWQAIGDLLAGTGGGATSNQLMHAILLGSEAVQELGVDADSKAARERLNQSKSILQGLVKKQSGDTTTPTRYLAALLQQESNVLNDLTQTEQEQLNQEIRRLYQKLIDNSSIEASDVYQYASYLLNQKESDDDAKIKSLINKLNSVAGSSLQALEVAVLFADRQFKRDQIPGLVADWANRTLDKLPSIESSQSNQTVASQSLTVLGAAGSSLQKLGFADEASEWFERAYQEHPTRAIAPYVASLVRVGNVDKAVEECAKHYAEYHDAQSATLLVEAMLNLKDSGQQSGLIREHEDALADARERFQDNAAFLEGLGTLKMSEGKYDEAVDCFIDALEVSPESVRAMNNLAMSFAEIPERASEGLEPINSALRLTNQNPELLDTKGVVLMASGRLSEAEKTFTEAFAASSEPRHLFHVILAQVNQEKESQAAKNWQDLDLDKLDPTGLTANEREKLNKLKTKFATASSPTSE